MQMGHDELAMCDNAWPGVCHVSHDFSSETNYWQLVSPSVVYLPRPNTRLSCRTCRDKRHRIKIDGYLGHLARRTTRSAAAKPMIFRSDRFEPCGDCLSTGAKTTLVATRIAGRT